MTIPGAVRSWGDAHARYGRLSRDASSSRRRSSSPATASRPGTASSTPSRARPRWQSAALGPEAGVLRGLPAPRPAVAAGRARPLAGPCRDARAPRRRRLRRLLRRRPRGAPGGGALAPSAAPCGRPTSATHRSTWGEPIETTYRGVRVTTHPPNSSGVVALELLNILEAVEPPEHAAFRRGGHDRRRPLDPPRDRGGEARDGRSRRPPDRSRVRRHPGRAAARQGATPRSSRRGSTRPGRPSGALDQPARRRDDLPRRRRRRRQRGQPHRVELPRLRVRRRRSRRRASTTRTGAATSRSTRTTRTCSRPASGRSTRSCPGCSSGTARRGPWIVAGSMGGDAQPQIHAQLVTRPRRRRARHPGRRRGAALVRRAGRALRAAPTMVRIEPRFPGAVLEALEAMGHPLPADGGLRRRARATSTRSSSSTADRRNRTGSVAAVTDPRSAGLPAVW